MSRPKEPELVVMRRAKPSPLQKLYRTKKFKQGWAEFEEAFATGKDIGKREGLKDGARRERKKLRRALLGFLNEMPYTEATLIRLWLECQLKSRAKRKGKRDGTK